MPGSVVVLMGRNDEFLFEQVRRKQFDDVLCERTERQKISRKEVLSRWLLPKTVKQRHLSQN